MEDAALVVFCADQEVLAALGPDLAGEIVLDRAGRFGFGGADERAGLSEVGGEFDEEVGVGCGDGEGEEAVAEIVERADDGCADRCTTSCRDADCFCRAVLLVCVERAMLFRRGWVFVIAGGVDAVFAAAPAAGGRRGARSRGW